MQLSQFQNNNTIKTLEKKGWELHPFNKVLKDKTKFANKIKKEHYLEEGKYPVIDQGKKPIGGYTNESLGLYEDTPYIIFGDHTRVLKYIDFPSFIGADGVKLLQNVNSEESVLTKYLFYFLKTIDIPNTGYNRHFKYLKEIVIPLPNKRIQTQIVEVLERAEDLINKRRAQIELLNSLIQSVFFEMFGNPIANNFNWEKTKLGDIANVTKLAGFEYTKYIKYLKDGEIIAVKGQNIKERKISLDKIDYIESDISNALIRSKLYKGNIVMTYVGVNLGDVAYIDEDNKYHLAPNVAKIYIDNQNIIDPIYLLNYLHYKKDSMRKNSFNTAKQAYNMAIIREFEIALPEIELQQRFADIYNKINQQIEMHKFNLFKLENNFNSLMHHAFTGELFNN
ncbi:restriction endonuclease subunit S [Priestia megaterium]